ncbi:hypothetical protein FIV00_26670 [Labrenzia sp. THAF82]|uniref:DNA -binding domain-containing protein n=1 Tax=Labrenzia sp. THAF82 TaxID=2587861 RepID=UPI001267EE36|nr:DUF2285 domain-containing protein [Labrenzia sp. THAF82]QFT34108.1 hypothetical protein FIV00_26670 [Labrenzia sp. THAF82]
MREPKFSVEPPGGDEITDYDREHLKTYLRLLDADTDGADWEEVVEIVMGVDTAVDSEKAKRMHASHLARARWMTESGFLGLLKGGKH